jgi:hypothetical protein
VVIELVDPVMFAGKLLVHRVLDSLTKVGTEVVRLTAGNGAPLSFITILLLYPEKDGNRINPSLAD